MEMWPVSTNPTVAPPEIKSMPGRPGKLRKKEAGESKKSGKLPRTGLAMTCSNCNVRGHNKRGCPQRVESSTREEPSNIDKGNGKTSGLGRPKKTQTEGEHSTKRSRGRPPAAPSASPGPAKRSRGRPPAAPSASPGPAKRSRGRPLAVPSASAALTKGARGRPPNASATPAKSARGRPPAAASAPPTCPSPANYHEEEGVGEAQPHTKGKQSLEWPGMSSCKIFSTGTTKVTKSADVTGDIGYKPSTAPKLKWNGKAAISTSKLQEMREEQRKKSKGSSS
ncbi:oleosin-B6-like [Solanum verrucosum]|uniref:oleosin-B6-like n=1 Tax=Solanum verrucosum TaxID=315347 RepID=UPI0020D14EFC|nr:oleosin-B6-like [Solanum verrucosum]